jgi:hypothetical protein
VREELDEWLDECPLLRPKPNEHNSSKMTKSRRILLLQSGETVSTSEHILHDNLSES